MTDLDFSMPSVNLSDHPDYRKMLLIACLEVRRFNQQKPPKLENEPKVYKMLGLTYEEGYGWGYYVAIKEKQLVRNWLGKDLAQALYLGGFES
jgi:hypothetical protein